MNKELLGAVFIFVVCLYFLIPQYKRNKRINKEGESDAFMIIRLRSYYLLIIVCLICIIKLIVEIIKLLKTY